MNKYECLICGNEFSYKDLLKIDGLYICGECTVSTIKDAGCENKFMESEGKDVP